MADSEAELQAPLLLIAMPQVLDPFFHRSVVLLVHHDAEGSFGFIVNRPTAISVAEILSGMEIEWTAEPTWWRTSAARCSRSSAPCSSAPPAATARTRRRRPR